MVDFQIKCVSFSNDNSAQFGLFSTRAYAAGELVTTLSGEESERPTQHTVEIAPNLHVLDPNAYFMNHSFTPTCQITGREVRAACEVNKGDELTFDYATTETTLVAPFMCDGILVGNRELAQGHGAHRTRVTAVPVREELRTRLRDGGGVTSGQ